jgi:hypothetical protein
VTVRAELNGPCQRMATIFRSRARFSRGEKSTIVIWIDRGTRCSFWLTRVPAGKRLPSSTQGEFRVGRAVMLARKARRGSECRAALRVLAPADRNDAGSRERTSVGPGRGISPGQRARQGQGPVRPTLVGPRWTNEDDGSAYPIYVVHPARGLVLRAGTDQRRDRVML